MDLDDLIKGLYENFTLGRLPERQFNCLMTEYDTEQSNLEQRMSELETATKRIYPLRQCRLINLCDWLRNTVILRN